MSSVARPMSFGRSLLRHAGRECVVRGGSGQQSATASTTSNPNERGQLAGLHLRPFNGGSLPHDKHSAAKQASESISTEKLPDLVLLTADITILADGRSWKRGTVIEDPEVVAQLFAAGGPGFTFYREV